MEVPIEKKKRSEKLTEREWREVKVFIIGFPTATKAAIALGIGRETMLRVRDIGSGRPETLQIIREKLKEVNA